MTGTERRKKLLNLMRESKTPLSGGALGSATGVSRQVIVQDIALLRTEGHSILATARGYLLEEPADTMRLFKVFHDAAATEEELTTIVDLGGCVVDVMVNHRVYGKVSPANQKPQRCTGVSEKSGKRQIHSPFKCHLRVSFSPCFRRKRGNSG